MRALNTFLGEDFGMSKLSFHLNDESRSLVVHEGAKRIEGDQLNKVCEQLNLMSDQSEDISWSNSTVFRPGITLTKEQERRLHEGEE